MTLPAASPASTATVPSGSLAPAPCAQHFDALTDRRATYYAAESELGYLLHPDRDREADTADKTARLDAARAGTPIPPGNPAAAKLAADRATATVAAEVAGSLLVEAHDAALAAAREHLEAGRQMSLDQVARARAVVDAAQAALIDAADGHARALGTFGFWQRVADGKGLNWPDHAGGAFTVGHKYAAAVDYGEMFRPLRERLQRVDELLALSAPVPVPVEAAPPSEYIVTTRTDGRRVKIRRDDVLAPVGTRPTPPAA